MSQKKVGPGLMWKGDAKFELSSTKEMEYYPNYVAQCMNDFAKTI